MTQCMYVTYPFKDTSLCIKKSHIGSTYMYSLDSYTQINMTGQWDPDSKSHVTTRGTQHTTTSNKVAKQRGSLATQVLERGWLTWNRPAKQVT